jgi:hypothetical protein
MNDIEVMAGALLFGLDGGTPREKKAAAAIRQLRDEIAGWERVSRRQEEALANVNEAWLEERRQWRNRMRAIGDEAFYRSDQYLTQEAWWDFCKWIYKQAGESP